MASFAEPWSKRHKAVTKNDRGGLTYNLSNSFAQPTSQKEIEAFAEARGDVATLNAYRDHPLGYTPNGGSADLREAAAELYDECGADDVLVTSGGQVALQHVCSALLTKRDHAIVFSPGYQSCQAAPAHSGAAVTKVRLSKDAGWAVDVDAVEAACLPARGESAPSGRRLRARAAGRQEMDGPWTSRGTAAAAARIFRGDGPTVRASTRTPYATRDARARPRLLRTFGPGPTPLEFSACLDRRLSRFLLAWTDASRCPFGPGARRRGAVAGAGPRRSSSC